MADTKFIPPVFQPFEWTHRAFSGEGVSAPVRVLADFANAAWDIGQGVDTVLSMLEHDAVADCDGEQRILSAMDASHLLRLARRSSAMLRDESERLMHWAYEHHTPEGREVHGKSEVALRKARAAPVQ
jgi:hypothetical protein